MPQTSCFAQMDYVIPWHVCMSTSNMQCVLEMVLLFRNVAQYDDISCRLHVIWIQHGNGGLWQSEATVECDIYMFSDYSRINTGLIWWNLQNCSCSWSCFHDFESVGCRCVLIFVSQSRGLWHSWDWLAVMSWHLYLLPVIWKSNQKLQTANTPVFGGTPLCSEYQWSSWCLMIMFYILWCLHQRTLCLRLLRGLLSDSPLFFPMNNLHSRWK